MLEAQWIFIPLMRLYSKAAKPTAGGRGGCGEPFWFGADLDERVRVCVCVCGALGIIGEAARGDGRGIRECEP